MFILKGSDSFYVAAISKASGMFQEMGGSSYFTTLSAVIKRTAGYRAFFVNPEFKCKEYNIELCER